MTRVELAEKVGIALKVEIKEADKAILAVLGEVVTGLMEDGDVILRGFGRFTVQNKRERVGRNPKTGEKVIIPALKRVSFKAGKNLKGFVNC